MAYAALLYTLSGDKIIKFEANEEDLNAKDYLNLFKTNCTVDVNLSFDTHICAKLSID